MIGLGRLNKSDEELLRVVELVSDAAKEAHDRRIILAITKGHHGEPSTCPHPDCKLARNLRLTLRTTL